MNLRFQKNLFQTAQYENLAASRNYFPIPAKYVIILTESIHRRHCSITLYKDLDGSGETLSGEDNEKLELAKLDMPSPVGVAKSANFIDVQDCCWEFFKRKNFKGDSQIQEGATVDKIEVTGISIKSVRRVDC